MCLSDEHATRNLNQFFESKYTASVLGDVRCNEHRTRRAKDIHVIMLCAFDSTSNTTGKRARALVRIRNGVVSRG